MYEFGGGKNTWVLAWHIAELLNNMMEVLLNDRDIAMQVASPGIDRAIKNDIEYSVFVGRGVRVLCASTGDWTAGIIQSATEAGVVIASDDTTHSIPFADIQKAKLDYSQEVR